MRRAGGNQVIPRPTAWRPGPPAPWESSPASLPPIDVATIAEVLRARGPGKAPAMELEDARHSAVLVPLYDGPDGAEVLLTRRSQALRNHRGEVSFPGGRMDPGETPLQTALRETRGVAGRLAEGASDVVSFTVCLQDEAPDYRSGRAPVLSRQPAAIAFPTSSYADCPSLGHCFTPKRITQAGAGNPVAQQPCPRSRHELVEAMRGRQRC